MTDRRQLARECAEIEKIGGSVRYYLACCGFVSPWGTWYRLQREELHRKDIQITDGKGGQDMRKLTLENKKKAVQIAMDGGNPLKFLKEIGMANPSASWQYIKKCLKAQDPGKYDKLMQNDEPVAETLDIPAADHGVTVQLVGQDAVNSYYSDGSVKVNLTANNKELEKPEEVTITKPVNYGGFEVCQVRDPKTDDLFSYDRKHNMMGWRTEAGDDVVMTPEEWREFIGKIPTVMEILGI